MSFPHYTTKNADETIRLGRNLGQTLKPGDAVFLFGDLGAGKTHSIKGLAEGLGIHEVIKSPTYTFVRGYEVEGVRFYHYDLYRLAGYSDSFSIGYSDTMADPKAIHAVEWAERLEGHLPSRRIEVHLKTLKKAHRVQIKWIDPEAVPQEMIPSFYREFMTPIHVRRHCKKVADVAVQLAKAMMQRLRPVDVEALYVASMLHDMVRVIDFRELKRDAFKEVVTEKKWQRWSALREQYKGRNHADVACEVLTECGFAKTGAIIGAHYTRYLIERPEMFDTIEKKIVYYADKRVVGDKIVSLKERFADGRKRWFDTITPELEQSLKVRESAVDRLEEELFEGLRIGPKDIY